MSFLGDIVNSIGGERGPLPLQKPPSRPNSANTARTINTSTKNAPRPGLHPTPPASTGMKRKASGDSFPPNPRAGKPTNPSEPPAKRIAAPPLHAPKAQNPRPIAAPHAQSTSILASQSLNPAAPADSAAIKSAPKGSYAEMMARAKQSAELRTQSQVGTIKHQDTKKDKMSKLAERRKMEQDRINALKANSTLKKDFRKDARPSASPTRRNSGELSKPPSDPPKTIYKGTMGMAASRFRARTNGRPGAKRARLDEYLGTDEEDNSDIAGEEGDYGSDASSDMEAGFDDMEMEEARALRAAKEADAEEMATENRLKREKEERRQKLAGLVKKQQR